MFRAVALVVVALSTFVFSGGVQAADGIEVHVLGVPGESFWRPVGGEWQATQDQAFRAASIVGDVDEFELRPAGAPWFSRHLITAEIQRASELQIVVGNFADGVQDFFYDGELRQLRMISVPEPKRPGVAAGGIAAAALFWLRRKGVPIGCSMRCDGADAARASLRSANDFAGRQGVDE